jgi:hypothetical protein
MSMTKTTQLRMYAIQQGKLREFVDRWRAGVYPLRLKQGFTVDGAWVIEEESRFVWLLSYQGSREEWRARNDEYYASPERKAISPDPAKLIAFAEEWFVEPVPYG